MIQLRAQELSQSIIQVNYTQDPEVFNRSKLPMQSLPLSSAVAPFAVDLNQHSQSSYLESIGSVPLLWQAPKRDDLDLTLASLNVLDPWVARFDGNPKNNSTSLRYKRIANAFKHLNIGVISTQESHQGLASAFVDRGFISVGKEVGVNAKKVNLSIIRPIAEAESLWAGFVYAKRQWTGLMTHINTQIYDIDTQKVPQFKAYADANQKGWPFALSATASFFGEALKYPAQISALFQAAVVAFSGVARKDGVLTSFLTHKETQLQVICCNTHIESYNREIAHRQIDEYSDHVKELQQSYPEAIILLTGDFNTPLINPAGDHSYKSVIEQIRAEVGGVSMPLIQIEPTLLDHKSTIDGAFVVAPSHQVLDQIQGKTLFPGSYQDQDIELSDHKAVIVQARLSPAETF